MVAGAIYPQFVQRVQVEPNEPEKEQPYIARNIEATTAAMGLGDVEVTPFELEEEPEAVDLAGNADTIRNIRIWDPSDNILGSTFEQLQGIRDYYVVNNVDVDRYELNGEPTQVLLSVRDLNADGIPRKSWAAEHLTYTHGYGAIVAPANEKEASGEPSFVAEDIPYRAAADELDLSQPAVYFGEDLGGYVVVGSRQREINFEDEDETKYTTYEGEDGVALDNVVKKAAFALRFGDLNPLISDQLTGSSKLLYIRDIRERVSALAPFLDLDADPYPVIHDGRIVWIVDAYTTTSRYPYAQRVETGQLADESGLDHTFNYVRNSVKVGRRRLRRHRRLLRHAGRGSDHRRLPRCLPRAVQGLRGDAGGPAVAPPLPGGPLPHPDHLVGQVPRDRGRQLLPGQRLLGRRPRPRHRHRLPRSPPARAPPPRPPRTPRRPAERIGSSPTTCSRSSRARTTPSSCSCDRSSRFGRTTTASS